MTKKPKRQPLILTYFPWTKIENVSRKGVSYFNNVVSKTSQIHPWERKNPL